MALLRDEHVNATLSSSGWPGYLVFLNQVMELFLTSQRQIDGALVSISFVRVLPRKYLLHFTATCAMLDAITLAHGFNVRRQTDCS